MTATKAPARPRSAARKAAKPKPAAVNGAGGDGYEPPAAVRPPEQFIEKAVHPIYGDKKLYVYHPKDGSDPIEFPHISTCRPTALFFYENRNKDEMRQAFAWMDLSGIPDFIGRRVFTLPEEEQATVIRDWFAGLNLTPQQGVAPPGES